MGNNRLRQAPLGGGVGEHLEKNGKISWSVELCVPM